MRRMVVFYLLAAWWMACTIVTAQEYSLHNFTGADGLGNLTIQNLYQDRNGFLWVSTENGLFRFDGSRFEPFGAAQGLPPTRGASFGETSDGTLLVGGASGLFRFAHNRFAKLSTPFNTVAWPQGIQTGTQGQTYLATETGLFEITSQSNPSAFTFHRLYPVAGLPPETLYSVFSDGDTLWFGCGPNLCRMLTGQNIVFTQNDGLLNVPLSAVVKDREGNLWVRARNQGVLELPVGQTRFRRPDTPLPGRALSGTPALDRDGRILLGAADRLLIHDEKGWQSIDRNVGLRGGVYAALEDRQHVLWMGTGGHGLTQWKGYREWEGYSSASGLPGENIYEILPMPDGSLFVGTETGLVYGRQNGFGITWTTVPGTSELAVHSLQLSPSGDLWISTSSNGIGVLHLHDNKVRKLDKLDWFNAKQGLAPRVALTIRFDRQQQLWAATAGGIFVAKPPYTTFSRVPELPAKWFWNIAEGTDGTIWAGGTDGLFALTAGRWQHWDHTNGLSNQSIVALGPDKDGSLWIGYEHGGGIDHVHLTPQGIAIQQGVQRPGTDGLIYFLNFDRSGHLWAGTEKGVDIWDRSTWSHIDTTDGLIWDDCDLNGFAEAADGTIWLGTSGGLSRFKQRPDPSPERPPVVVFTSLRIGNDSILDGQKTSFPWSAGPLIAQFAAPATLQDSSLIFRYRLQGAGTSWAETMQRQIELSSIAPGHYRLEVEARDHKGIWSAQPATFAFTIQPPWYRRAWFITLLVLVPFIGAIVVLRIRSIRAKKREQRLQQIVDEKTADLRKANEELRHLTMVDALTGVSNRRHFDLTLANECDRIKRSGATVSLLIVDVDHFKALNDSAGHQKGDEYLVILGAEFNLAARRQIDLVARIGGEEFAFILPATNTAEAAQFAEGLRSRIAALALPHPQSAVGPSLTISIGVATATPEQYRSPDELVSKADQALYRAKSQGRNCVRIA